MGWLSKLFVKRERDMQNKQSGGVTRTRTENRCSRRYVLSDFQTLSTIYTKMSASVYISAQAISLVSLTTVFHAFIPPLFRAWLSAQTSSLWARHTVLHEIIMRLHWWFHKVSSSPNVTAFGLLTCPALVISLIDLPCRPGEPSQNSCGSEDGLKKSAREVRIQ